MEIILPHAVRPYLVILSIAVSAICARAQAPVNDNCANAIPITVNSSCLMGSYTNENATTENTSVAPAPGCRNYGGSDVWFTAVMPASGALRVEAETIGYSLPPSVSVYSGTCGSFTELICYQVDPDKTIFNPALAGQTLYIRVFSYNSPVGHPFTLCLFEPSIPSNDDCANAITTTGGYELLEQ